MPVNDVVPVLDYELSMAFALSTEAMPHFCYANAWHVFKALAHWSDVSCLVEGWMVLEQASGVSLIEHAWCTCGKRLLDPSIVLLFPKDQWISLFYLPGVLYSQADLQGIACRDLPAVRSCGRFGSDGMGHSAYRAAYECSYHQAMHLREACSPPKPLSIHPSFPPARERTRRLVVQVVSSRDVGRTENRDGRKSISQRKQKAGDGHANSHPDTGL